MEILDKFKKALDEQLCIITPPVAIKFLEKMQDIPGNMGRPLRELGERIRPCETWHYARHFLVVLLLAIGYPSAQLYFS